MIEFVNVCKTYNDNNTDALHDINLYIGKGEFVFIVGSSGSGKSTLIKLLMKEEEVTQGKIFLENKDVTYLSKKEIPYYRRNMGVIFQDFRLLPNKTVYENVAFALQIMEVSPRTIRRKVPSVLAMVGLEEKMKAYPHQISGGEQQRTAVARAIVNTPPILLADEPTGNLDPETAWEIMVLLDEINKMGTTVIIATHAWDIVDDMQKRVVTLNNGVLVRDIDKGGYDDEI